MNYKIQNLPNKLKTLVVEDASSPSVAILLLVGVGSRYEGDKVNGVAHFVEHTIFKGTEKRKNSAEIGMEVETLGARMNAFTAQDYTGYYIKAPKEHFGQCLEVLADMFLNSKFEEREIEKERGVIIEEKRMYEDQPMDKVVDIFNENLFRSHELGRDIVGSIKTIKAIKRADIKNFISKYSAGNTIAIVAGSVDKNQVEDGLKQALGRMKPKNEGKLNLFSPREIKKEIYNLKKEVNQTHLMLGGIAPSRLDGDRFIFMVADSILAKGFRSRLFQVIRDELGLAYYIYSRFQQYQEVGSFGIGMGVENSRANEAVHAVLNQMNEVSEGEFSEDELTRAKNYLIGQLTIGLETSDDIALWYGLQLLLNKEVLSIEEVKKKILAVSREDIIRVFSYYIHDENLVLAGVSPYKSLKVEF